MKFTFVQSVIVGGVTLDHDPPSSRVTCTRPLSVPIQTTPSAVGEGEMAKMTPQPQAVARSTGTSPSHPVAPSTAPVRSGLMIFQEWPSSYDRYRTWVAW